MVDRENVINGLEFTKAMITFNPSTGEDKEHGNLNEADKISYDACVGAIALLKEQQEIVRCISCTFYRSDGECALHNGKWRPEGFCSWAICKEGR